MFTLDEHNKRVFDPPKTEYPKAGVLCDSCGTEMLYMSDIVLLTNPPQRHVNCPNCAKIGIKWG